jgi:hypothetical protein
MVRGTTLNYSKRVTHFLYYHDWIARDLLTQGNVYSYFFIEVRKRSSKVHSVFFRVCFHQPQTLCYRFKIHTTLCHCQNYNLLIHIIIKCIVGSKLHSYYFFVPPTLFQRVWNLALWSTNSERFFPPKTVSPKPFVITPKKAVIPIISIATIDKSAMYPPMIKPPFSIQKLS